MLNYGQTHHKILDKLSLDRRVVQETLQHLNLLKLISNMYACFNVAANLPCPPFT